MICNLGVACPINRYSVISQVNIQWIIPNTIYFVVCQLLSNTLIAFATQVDYRWIYMLFVIFRNVCQLNFIWILKPVSMNPNIHQLPTAYTYHIYQIYMYVYIIFFYAFIVTHKPSSTSEYGIYIYFVRHSTAADHGRWQIGRLGWRLLKRSHQRTFRPVVALMNVRPYKGGKGAT